MGETIEALEGAVALIGGGLVFLLVASALDTGSYLNASFLGMFAIVGGILVFVTAIGVGVGELMSRGG